VGGLSRQLCKLCDPRDFEDERFLAMVREILPERDPSAFVERKAWEFATAALALEDLGRLTDETEALGVGAGDERFVFWLANRAGRVVATDIYGEGEFASREAGASMLDDPSAHAPFPYREDRLEVRWMDARSLDFPDASFDVVFSISSVEHFGGPGDIERAAREIGRVLRPGGHAVVVTECFVRRHPLNAAPVDLAVRAASLNTRRRTATLRRRGVVDEVFTPRELRTRIVGPSGLALVQPLDLSVAPSAWDNLTQTHPDGRLEPRTGEHWPHVLLRHRRSVFTSVCLVLEKPG
jgi:SAM-dependent methyltransferase